MSIEILPFELIDKILNYIPSSIDKKPTKDDYNTISKYFYNAFIYRLKIGHIKYTKLDNSLLSLNARNMECENGFARWTSARYNDESSDEEQNEDTSSDDSSITKNNSIINDTHFTLNAVDLEYYRLTKSLNLDTIHNYNNIQTLSLIHVIYDSTLSLPSNVIKLTIERSKIHTLKINSNLKHIACKYLELHNKSVDLPKSIEYINIYSTSIDFTNYKFNNLKFMKMEGNQLVYQWVLNAYSNVSDHAHQYAILNKVPENPELLKVKKFTFYDTRYKCKLNKHIESVDFLYMNFINIDSIYNYQFIKHIKLRYCKHRSEVVVFPFKHLETLYIRSSYVLGENQHKKHILDIHSTKLRSCTAINCFIKIKNKNTIKNLVLKECILDNLNFPNIQELRLENEMIIENCVIKDDRDLDDNKMKIDVVENKDRIFICDDENCNNADNKIEHDVDSEIKYNTDSTEYNDNVDNKIEYKTDNDIDNIKYNKDEDNVYNESIKCTDNNEYSSNNNNKKYSSNKYSSNKCNSNKCNSNNNECNSNNTNKKHNNNNNNKKYNNVIYMNKLKKFEYVSYRFNDIEHCTIYIHAPDIQDITIYSSNVIKIISNNNSRCLNLDLNKNINPDDVLDINYQNSLYVTLNIPKITHEYLYKFRNAIYLELIVKKYNYGNIFKEFNNLRYLKLAVLKDTLKTFRIFNDIKNLERLYINSECDYSSGLLKICKSKKIKYIRLGEFVLEL